MKNKLAKRSRKLSRVCPDAARICDEVAGWITGAESYSPQTLADSLTQAAMELRDFDKWDKKALGLIDVALGELREEKAALLKALKAAVERMEAVSEGIPVEKRSAGVSQATHVRHMAGHLAQHAKIARAAIARAEKGEGSAKSENCVVVEVNGGLVDAVYCGEGSTYPDVYILDRDNGKAEGKLRAMLIAQTPLEDAPEDILKAMGIKPEGRQE